VREQREKDAPNAGVTSMTGAAVKVISMELNLENKAQLLRALGHPARLRIAAELAGRCACVKEIWECLDMPQAVVSQHLKVMRENGLLEARREGARVCYSLKNSMLVELVGLLQVAAPSSQSFIIPSQHLHTPSVS
jgi:DNA-binding transcriptional ArsR family regulator